MRKILLNPYGLVPVSVLLALLLAWLDPYPLSLFVLKFKDMATLFSKGTPSEKVLFLAVDEESVNRYGRWPWDREEFAKGLSALSQAELVVLDMVFSEPTGEKDRALAETLAELDNTICGFFLRPKATERISPEVAELLSESALERVSFSVPRLVEGAYAEANILPIQQACMASASFSTVADEDGLYRRYPLASVFRGGVYPILGIQALRYALNRDLVLTDKGGVPAAFLGEEPLPVDGELTARLRYYPPESYRIIPFVRAASGEVPPETFTGKIVVVGVSEAGVTDIRPTPLGPLPGPLLHYTFLSNVLQGELLASDRRADLAAVALLGLIPLLFLRLLGREKIVIRVAGYAGIYLLFFGGNLLLLQAHFLLETFYPLLALGLAAATSETALFRNQEEESRFIKEAFRSYLSPELLNQISKHPEQLKLGGEEREISILFSDVRGFTTLSENVTALELVEILTSLFTPMTRVIIDHEGMLDKYIGDAIMALFNAPMDVEEHPAKACRAALAMIRELEKVNGQLAARKLPPVDIGVGINTGLAVAGNMGSAMRFNYSAIGDPVNLASRLEGQTKLYGTRIVISEYTRERLPEEEFALRCLGETMVKGKARPVRIFDVMEPTPAHRELALLFEKGLAAEEAGERAEAERIYRECMERYGDKVAVKALERLTATPV